MGISSSERARLGTADTIAAISTPPGVGGIAVVRLSGSEAFDIARRHLSSEARFATFGVGEGVIDEVVVNRFKAPHSYTGDDTVEFACHGSLYVQQALLQALVSDGARLAHPGEFTRRAFLNGRLDLSQAEAVADLIDSTNAGAHQLALSQLRGGYSRRLKELRDQLVELASLLELELDFSDEDVEFADRGRLLALLDSAAGECRRLCESFRLGNAVKNGVPVAIVGRPNVGKSTLLNALVGEDRAIVSDIAGTTRDTVEDTLTLGGITFRFIDTAGIRSSSDDIEQLGIERSYRAAEKALVVLYVADSAEARSASVQLDELRQTVSLDGKEVFLLLNKSDLCPVEAAPGCASFSACRCGVDDVFAISAKTGQGLESLREALCRRYSADSVSAPTVSNVRHFQALSLTLAALGQVRQGLEQGLPADLLVIDLRDALYHLGTITGQVTSDDILSSIFSRFCIGK